MNKNKKQLESFVKYCEDNPEYRFFQALRNWIQQTINVKWNWLFVSDGEDDADTFYWE